MVDKRQAIIENTKILYQNNSIDVKQAIRTLRTKAFKSVDETVQLLELWRKK